MRGRHTGQTAQPKQGCSRRTRSAVPPPGLGCDPHACPRRPPPDAAARRAAELVCARCGRVGAGRWRLGARDGGRAGGCKEARRGGSGGGGGGARQRHRREEGGAWTPTCGASRRAPHAHRHALQPRASRGCGTGGKSAPVGVSGAKCGHAQGRTRARPRLQGSPQSQRCHSPRKCCAQPFFPCRDRVRLGRERGAGHGCHPPHPAPSASAVDPRRLACLSCEC